MRRTILPLLALALALVAGGCDGHTCEAACAQYYGQDAGECGRPSVLTDGTTPGKAERACVEDCRAAFYRTVKSTAADTDAGGYARLENETDAIEFIDCIVDRDYSDAVFNQTCEDLFFECPWIRW